MGGVFNGSMVEPALLIIFYHDHPREHGRGILKKVHNTSTLIKFVNPGNFHYCHGIQIFKDGKTKMAHLGQDSF
jgi:hypothetical protein